MTQDTNPGPEDCDPPDEGEGQQSKRDGPGPGGAGTVRPGTEDWCPVPPAFSPKHLRRGGGRGNQVDSVMDRGG